MQPTMVSRKSGLPEYSWGAFLVCVAITAGCSLLVAQLSIQLTGLLILGLSLLVLLLIWQPSLSRWHYLYLAAVLVLPPLYPELLGGGIPVFISHGILAVGGIAFLSRHESFSWRPDSVTLSSSVFLLALALSVPFVFWLSGPLTGFSSCLRFLLILQPFLLYAWLRGSGLVSTEQAVSKIIKFLLILGSLSAAYGILDFYYPIPIQHPFADQYIYLLSGSIRRAQGVFYEASSFGNLCAFYWSLCLVTLNSPVRKQLRLSRIIIGLLVGVFTVALFLSYSRGSWANALTTVLVYFLFQRRFRLRPLFSSLVLTSVFLFLVYQLSPELITNFAERRVGPLVEIWWSPDVVTSGRWETWKSLFAFFADHPWLLLFGVGYKSISETSLLGQSIVVDNGYLSVLFETGIVGLLSLLWLLAGLFRALLPARYQSEPLRGHLAAFLFSFWCGQLVQMLTGDILTFWRNMVVFFAMAACAIQPGTTDSVNTHKQME